MAKQTKIEDLLKEKDFKNFKTDSSVAKLLRLKTLLNYMEDKVIEHCFIDDKI